MKYKFIFLSNVTKIARFTGRALGKTIFLLRVAGGPADGHRSQIPAALTLVSAILLTTIFVMRIMSY
jgi:hypothetical protein